MKRILALFIWSFSLPLFAGSQYCFDEAERLFLAIGHDDYPLSHYNISASSSQFAAEPTVVYRFARNIVDDWVIELVEKDCFLIHIKFNGDL